MVYFFKLMKGKMKLKMLSIITLLLSCLLACQQPDLPPPDTGEEECQLLYCPPESQLEVVWQERLGEGMEDEFYLSFKPINVSFG